MTVSQDTNDSLPQMWKHCHKSVDDSFQNESETVRVDAV